MAINYYTKDGLQKLKDELVELKTKGESRYGQANRRGEGQRGFE